MPFERLAVLEEKVRSMESTLKEMSIVGFCSGCSRGHSDDRQQDHDSLSSALQRGLPFRNPGPGMSLLSSLRAWVLGDLGAGYPYTVVAFRSRPRKTPEMAVTIRDIR
jgi:hypothetical protein